MDYEIIRFWQCPKCQKEEWWSDHPEFHYAHGISSWEGIEDPEADLPLLRIQCECNHRYIVAVRSTYCPDCRLQVQCLGQEGGTCIPAQVRMVCNE